MRDLILLVLLMAGAASARTVEDDRQILIRFIEAATTAEIAAFEKVYGLELLNEFPRMRLKHYGLQQEDSTDEVIASLINHRLVERVEKNHQRQLMAPPDDPLFPLQWYLNDTGQTVNGSEGAGGFDIDWLAAIDRYEGNESITVAVIDTGVALDHPDIFPNRWVNSGEILNGLDDDLNGYVDDIVGWDFVLDDNFPLDESGHGTLVASVIGAAADSGEGTAGVAPDVRIMAIRVLNQRGFLQPGLVGTAQFLLATDYAVLNGASVINYSIGGTGGSQFEFEQLQWIESQGVLFVAAAGNGGPDGIGDDNDSIPTFPASYTVDSVLSVAASNREGALASFSNFGPNSVDLAAPGINVVGADISRVNVYFEDFETGAGDWIQSSNTDLIWSLFVDGFGNTWLTDSVDPVSLSPVAYRPFTDSVAVTPPINLSSGVGQRLSYDIVYDLEFLFDYLRVEVTTDGGLSWSLVDFHTGTWLSFGDQETGFVDLSAFAGEVVQVRFRLISDGINEWDGVYIDNVRIDQATVFEYDGTQYQPNDGTSFAAPIVAGVAAMLKGKHPDLINRDLKRLILSSTVPRPVLNGRLLTGGTVSAFGAISAADELVNENLPVFASMLPSSRSAAVGSIVTAFVTIVNAGSTDARSCSIEPTTQIPALFAYQTTNPVTNAAEGYVSYPVDIQAGGNQSFIVAFQPTATFGATDVELQFDCVNSIPAGTFVGLNTLLLSSSATPTADVVALAATPSLDGVTRLAGAAGSNAFAVATVNVGSPGSVAVSADTGGAGLPLALFVCQTDPMTGLCNEPPAVSVSTTIDSGETPTFTVFATASGEIPFDPAGNRVFFRIQETGGNTVGSTSVAVTTME